MPDLWMPGAVVRPAGLTGGVFPGDYSYGKNAFGTVHTFEANPHKLSAIAGADYLNTVRYSVHHVYNPVTGQIVQTIPANRAGRGLQESTPPRTNRAGRVHFQVEVIAYAATPFTDYWTAAGRDAWYALMNYWNSWGVPFEFPAGPFASSAAAANTTGRRTAPGLSGIVGHSDWQDNVHWDPGALNQRVMLPSGGVPVVTDPVQRVKMWQEIIEVAVDGTWGTNTDTRSQMLAAAASAFTAGKTITANIKIIQEVIDVDVDGSFGPKSKTAFPFWIKSAQRWLGVAADGFWGPNTQAAYNKSRDVYNKASTSPTKPLNPFPLPSTDWYGQDDGTPRSHSGVRAADRNAIVKIQQQVGSSADGRFGPDTASAVKKKQSALKIDATGRVDRATWQKMFGG